MKITNRQLIALGRWASGPKEVPDVVEVKQVSDGTLLLELEGTPAKEPELLIFPADEEGFHRYINYVV